MMIRLKHLVFQYLTPLLIVFGGGLLAGTAYFGPAAEWPVVLSSVSIGLGLIYFIQKQKLDELRLFTDLFRLFNQRYNSLNEDLVRIVEATGELTDHERSVLIDYFNLCGEEYLYYQQGYIFPRVWNAWLNGMGYYFAQPRIREFWIEELGTGSYYGLNARQLSPRGTLPPTPTEPGTLVVAGGVR